PVYAGNALATVQYQQPGVRMMTLAVEVVTEVLGCY
ncbi:hypothetical protein HaLaN_02569, partial [Haematococcus lacustris]